MSFVRQHKGAVVWSVMLHIAAVAAVIVGLPWRLERAPPQMAAAAPIEGVIIDRAAIEREREKREEAARQEEARRQREERQRREAAEQQRLAEQREQQRQAAERERVAAEARERERQRQEAEQRERERVAAERAEQQRREEQAKAEREAQARREREEAERRAREAEQRRRQQAEAELQAQLQAEAEANAARAAGLLDQYMFMIQNHVKRYWERPLSARPGLVCVVNVVQAPTGDVLSATVNAAQCNGDEAVRRSVETAVLAASPLPRPPSQAVFSRTFTLTFAPDR